MQPADELRPERRRVRIGRARIYCESVGAGRPVVLIHGLSGSTRWWARNVDALARQFRVHVVDLVGFGGSTSGRPFEVSDAVEHLLGWMGAVGLERASLVGHSMGGLIATCLAADAPERVDRLVLIAPAVLPLGRRHVGHLWSLSAEVLSAPLDFLPVLVHDFWRAGPLNVLAAVREVLAVDTSEMLERVRCPCLLLWGRHDLLVPARLGTHLAGRLPDARLSVVEGAGHNPMWERPAEFNRLVAQFLGEGSAPSSSERGLE